jgi:hypothetical protein
MRKWNTTEMSPFMMDNLQLRCDTEKLLEFTPNIELDPKNDKYQSPWTLPKTSLILLFALPTYCYMKGQGTIYELVKTRSPVYRMRNAFLGVLSASLFGYAYFYNINDFKPYRPSLDN